MTDTASSTARYPAVTLGSLDLNARYTRKSSHPMSAFRYHDLIWAIGSRTGIHDVACPLCGPRRKASANQTRKVLRIWNVMPGRITFHCARCGESGHVRDRTGAFVDYKNRARIRRELIARDSAAKARRLAKALALWRARESLRGSIAETYLREARGYRGLLPPTLGFLPARSDYPPALIAAFGLPDEPEPYVMGLPEHRITGIHLTRLARDGRDRERGDKAKIMIGSSCGWPIALAPWNDGQALVVTEGIEDALSAHESTGLCAWAAGCASRLGALAGVVPDWIESVTILADNDQSGRRHARLLATKLSYSKSDAEIRLLVLGAAEGAPA